MPLVLGKNGALFRTDTVLPDQVEILPEVVIDYDAPTVIDQTAAARAAEGLSNDDRK